jgi:hypothetical protein
MDRKHLFADGAAAMTASGIAQVSGANAIIDLGGAPNRTDLGIVGSMSRVDMALQVDVSALVTANTDDVYRFHVMGANNADGSKPVMLGGIVLGNFTLISNGSTGSAATGAGSTSVPGRYEILFTNEQADIIYEYVYIWMALAGTAASITFTAEGVILPDAW